MNRIKDNTSTSTHHSHLGALPWLVAITLSACLLSLYLFNTLQVQSQEQISKAEVKHKLEASSQELERIVGNATSSLHAIEALVRQTPQLTQNDFEQFASHLSTDNPAIRGLQYAPKGIVTFVSNPELNQNIFGHNLYSDTGILPYLEEATSTGRAVLEGPRRLQQGGQALIMRNPIFKEKYAKNSQNLLGFAIVLIDYDYVKHAIIEPLEHQGLIVQVIHDKPLRNRPIYVHGQDSQPIVDSVSSTVYLPHGRWTLQAAPKEGWGPSLAIPSYLFLPVLLVLSSLIWMSMREYKSREMLTDALDNAQSANELKDRLIANVSHEIRTPLSSINSIAIMLAHQGYSEEVRELGKAVQQSSEVVNTIVNDLLDLSKIQHGYCRLNKSEFILEDLIENSATMLQRQWIQKTTVEPILLEPVDNNLRYFADKGRIEQVIQNLVTNAYKFTPFGQVCVKFDIQPKSNETDLLVVEVSDTGVGIEPHEIDKIFDAFYQVDTSLQKKYNGAGLGLAICRQIIGLMGGEIHAKSQTNVGTQFELRIPLERILGNEDTTESKWTQQNRDLLQLGETAWNLQLQQRLKPNWQVQFHEPQQDETRHANENLCLVIDLPPPYSTEKISRIRQFLTQHEYAAQHVVWLGHELPHLDWEHKVKLQMKPVTRSRLNRAFGCAIQDQSVPLEKKHRQATHLLLAEDNPLNAKIFKKLLENHGATISVVNNGADAVALLTSGNATFDAVLMDLQMPIMDGLQAARLIRKHEQLHGLPIYAITGHVSERMKDECLSIGFTSFVTKPFDPEWLMDDIHEHLTEKKNHSHTHNNSIFSSF